MILLKLEFLLLRKRTTLTSSIDLSAGPKDPNPLLAEHSAEITGDTLTCPSLRSPEMGLVFSEIAAPAIPTGASKSRRNQNPNQRAPKSHQQKPVPRLFRLLCRFLSLQRFRAYSPPTGDRRRDPLTEKPDHAPHRITARSLCNFLLGLLLPTSHRISPPGTHVRKPKPSAPATGSASTPSPVNKTHQRRL
ncbi:hypothetical protein U1Q18_001627 [Sarracenia purpurea var. burkii]